MPAYASACSTPGGYASACSCIGVFASSTTPAALTTFVTNTLTQTTSTSVDTTVTETTSATTVESVVTTTSTTTTSSAAATTTLTQAACTFFTLQMGSDGGVFLNNGGCGSSEPVQFQTDSSSSFYIDEAGYLLSDCGSFPYLAIKSNGEVIVDTAADIESKDYTFVTGCSIIGNTLQCDSVWWDCYSELYVESLGNCSPESLVVECAD